MIRIFVERQNILLIDFGRNGLLERDRMVFLWESSCLEYIKWDVLWQMSERFFECHRKRANSVRALLFQKGMKAFCWIDVLCVFDF